MHSILNYSMCKMLLYCLQCIENEPVIFIALMNILILAESPILQKLALIEANNKNEC